MGIEDSMCSQSRKNTKNHVIEKTMVDYIRVQLGTIFYIQKHVIMMKMRFRQRGSHNTHHIYDIIVDEDEEVFKSEVLNDIHVLEVDVIYYIT